MEGGLRLSRFLKCWSSPDASLRLSDCPQSGSTWMAFASFRTASLQSGREAETQ